MESITPQNGRAKGVGTALSPFPPLPAASLKPGLLCGMSAVQGVWSPRAGPGRNTREGKALDSHLQHCTTEERKPRAGPLPFVISGMWGSSGFCRWKGQALGRVPQGGCWAQTWTWQVTVGRRCKSDFKSSSSLPWKGPLIFPHWGYLSRSPLPSLEAPGWRKGQGWEEGRTLVVMRTSQTHERGPVCAPDTKQAKIRKGRRKILPPSPRAAAQVRIQAGTLSVIHMAVTPKGRATFIAKLW